MEAEDFRISLNRKRVNMFDVALVLAEGWNLEVSRL